MAAVFRREYTHRSGTDQDDGRHQEKQKPDPEGIYKILSALQCDKAVMVGDNPSDIYAGKNADVYSVGVKWTPKGEDSLDECEPDYMLGEMKDLIEFVEGVLSC